LLELVHVLRAMVFSGFALAALSASPAAAERVQIGLMTDMGLPDGIMGAVIVRSPGPVHVQAHAGAGHNSVAPGLRAGVQILAWSRAVTPYAALELGHYFRGRPGAWAQDLVQSSGDMGEMAAEGVTVESLGYSYGNAHLGLRLGGARAAFYLQAGVSRVHVDAELRRREEAGAGLPLQVDVVSESQARIWTPSARLGMEAYF
jgi:hypothetical protein